VNGTEKRERHDAVYTRVKPFEYSRITERILAGRNPLTHRDIDQLAQQGVTHILDLRQPREWMPPNFGEDALTAAEECGIVRLSLPVRDVTPPTPEDYDAAHIFLSDTLARENTQVYIHCRAGMERTAGILLAYLAHSEGISYDSAYEKARAARPVLQPTWEQEQATRVWLNAQI
jgi:protein-tyrosine phosphatase